MRCFDDALEVRRHRKQQDIDRCADSVLCFYAAQCVLTLCVMCADSVLCLAVYAVEMLLYCVALRCVVLRGEMMCNVCCV